MSRPFRSSACELPQRYPADGKSIDIEILGNAVTDGEELFWKTEPENLRRQVESILRPRISSREITHLSVFALGPIPLLVKLGSLLGDIVPMEVYQLHREPPQDGPGLRRAFPAALNDGRPGRFAEPRGLDQCVHQRGALAPAIGTRRRRHANSEHGGRCLTQGSPTAQIHGAARQCRGLAERDLWNIRRLPRIMSGVGYQTGRFVITLSISDIDPGCVKSRKINLCLELPSRFR